MGKTTESSRISRFAAKGKQLGSRCRVTHRGCRQCPGCPHCQPALLGSGPALTPSAALPQTLHAEGGARPQIETGRERMLAGLGEKEVSSVSKTGCRPSHSAAELEETLCPSCLPPASSWGWDNSSQGSVPFPSSVIQVTQRWIRVGFSARLEGAASGNARAQRGSFGWGHGGAGDGRRVGTWQSWGCGAGSVLPPAGGWEAEPTFPPPSLTPEQKRTAANLPSPPPGRNSISDPSTPGELTL